jgi:formylglycine-generating enzyme required for sulfatase activity
MKVEERTITLFLPRWLERLLVYGGVPLATLLGLSAVVYAAAVPNVFSDGQTLSAAAMNANFTALRDAIDALSVQQTGPAPDCPIGYARTTAAGAIPVVCKKGRDEMVKVGTRASAFWIDRYEAGIWSAPDGTGTEYGFNLESYPATFPKNGVATQPLYAVSQVGVPPSTDMTWFQADAACRASGKRLTTGDEWLMAASGTRDPGSDTGATGACNTSSGSLALRVTGGGATGCVSTWGAQDMIGNVVEYTAEWFTGVDGAGSARALAGIYGDDGSWNVAADARSSNYTSYTAGVPAAVMRGGYDVEQAQSGVFGLFLEYGPGGWFSAGGFRCALSR